ncbi:MAG: AsmA-like C-terminal domain-containing protein [Sedimenticolaceae bacterium]
MKIGTWKKIGAVTAVTALGCILLALGAPRFLDLNRYHDLIVSEVEKNTGGQVTLGNIRWGISHRLWLEVDEFSIINASAFAGDARFSRLFASISIPALLTKTIAVEELQMESPGIRITLEQGAREKNRPAEDPAPTGIQLPFGIEVAQMAIAVERFELSDSLTLPGETLVHVFSDAALSVKRAGPKEALAFTLSLHDKAPSGLGSIKARGTLSGLTRDLKLERPELRLHATLDDLSAGAIEPYLKANGFENRLAGSLSMQVDYAGDLGRNLHAQGSIELDRLSFADAVLWEAPLTGSNSKLDFQIGLDPQDLTLEKIALRRGALWLDVQGVLHDWSGRPSIRATASSSALPLRDLVPLIPWKKLGEDTELIRPVLEKGGELELSKLALAETSLEKLSAMPGEWMPGIEMTAHVAGVTLPAAHELPEFQNIAGTVQLTNGVAKVEGLTARLASLDLPPVTGEITAILGKPKIHARMSGSIKLDETSDERVYALLKQIGAGKVAEVSRLEKVVGVADLDLTLDLETARPNGYQLRGNIGFQNFLVKTAYSPALFRGIDASLDIEPAVITLSRASAVVALPDAANPTGDQFTVDFQATIDDWRGRPAVTLQGLKTSKIALPLLSSMIPWGELDQSAKRIDPVLHSGGFVTITALALPAIDLSGQAPDPRQLLADTKLAANLEGVTVPRGFAPTAIEEINGHITLEKNVLLAERVQARIGPVALPESNIRASDVGGRFKLALSSRGPLHLATGGDQQVEQLLLEHGLKSLDISAEIDVSADYDQRHPEDWTAGGSVVFEDVRAVTHPGAVTLDHLKGKVTFHREKSLSFSAQDISARIDGVPLRLSGNVSDIGSASPLVDVRAITRGLDLARMAELVPALKDMKAHGVLDVDVDVHVPYSSPGEIRLRGMLAARDAGLQLASSGLAVSDTDMDLVLIGKGIEIKSMTTTVNEQKLAVSGHLSNPVEPDIKLALTATVLDIDRLFPPHEDSTPRPATPSDGQQQAETKPKTADGSRMPELPTIARKTTAAIGVRAARGQYKGLEFEDLKLDLLFRRGVIERYRVDTKVDEGVFSMDGSADLRNPDRFSFTLNPDIAAVPLDAISPLFGIGKLPISGPLTLKGQLQGHTDTYGAIAGSLDGQLAASLGRGILSRSGKGGHLIEKLLSLTSIRTIFSGRLFSDLSSHGLPFEAMTAQLGFKNGTVNLDEFHFSSDVMTVDGQGTIDLQKERLNVEALVAPLMTVDDALNLVPLVGDALQDVSKIQIRVEGSLDEPRIHTEEAREIGESIETEVEQPTEMLKGFGKGLEKVF